jgi:hypothetical protein
MSTEARQRLAARQAELVCALAGKGGAPSGFDAARLHAASVALARKRRSVVARAWPALPAALGEHYAERFDAYAQTTPLPRVGGPLADGRAFLRWLAAAGVDVAAFSLPALAVDLRYRTIEDGLVPRRGPALKATIVRAPRRLVIALRLPWLGDTWLSIPIPG